MVTHCALSAQHIQKFAKADPFVYVGDFNIKPDSSMYALLTQGTIEKKVRLVAVFFFVLSNCLQQYASNEPLVATRVPLYRRFSYRHVTSPRSTPTTP